MEGTTWKDKHFYPAQSLVQWHIAEAEYICSELIRTIIIASEMRRVVLNVTKKVRVRESCNECLLHPLIYASHVNTLMQTPPGVNYLCFVLKSVSHAELLGLIYLPLYNFLNRLSAFLLHTCRNQVNHLSNLLYADLLAEACNLQVESHSSFFV